MVRELGLNGLKIGKGQGRWKVHLRQEKKKSVAGSNDSRDFNEFLTAANGDRRKLNPAKY